MSGFGGADSKDVTKWNGTAVATPTVAGVPEVDITHFGGTAGTFAAGRPEVTVNANNDKTGYSLTAGSYVIRASSTQRGEIVYSGAGSGTASISSVTVTRATLQNGGHRTNTASTDAARYMGTLTITNATTVTSAKDGPSDQLGHQWEVAEWF